MAFVPPITSEDVKEVAELAADNVDVHITHADILVSEELGTLEGEDALSDERLRLIGLYISAHYAFVYEGQVKSEKIGDTTTGYNMTSKLALNSTVHGQQALALDPSGRLADLNDQVDNGSGGGGGYDSPGTIVVC